MLLPPPRFLYLVHGALSYYQEAAYSILSLWRQPGGLGFGVVVVTDDPQPLRDLLGNAPQIQYLSYTALQRTQWIGAAGYIHRMKPNAMAWAMSELATSGDELWAFIDSDTSFLHPPQAWFDAVAQGAVVLHAQEGTVAGNRSHSRSQRRLADALAGQPITIRGANKSIAGESACK